MSQMINVQHFLSEQSRIIEMLAVEDSSLNKVLEKLTETIELVVPDIRVSILEFNEQLHSLENPIGPQLPGEMLDSMDGLRVGPNNGSCGTAAYLNEIVLVENAKTDQRWKDYRDVAHKFNLKACWSVPIVSSKNNLFGTLAFYPNECRLPNEEELGIFTQFSHLAAVIIDKKRSEDALQLANRLIENSPAVIFRWGIKEGWPIEYVSQNVNQYGYTPEWFIRERIDYSLIIHPLDLPRVEQEVQDFLDHHVDQFKQEYRIITADGSIRWVDDRTTVTRDDDKEILYIEGVLLDITDRKEAEQKVYYLANNDPLTEIPNRRYFKRELELGLRKLENTSNSLAVLYIDCDNFKQINDDLGHDAGDEFLRHLSGRLRNSLREDDLIARIGGDEFNVLLKGIESEEDVQTVAKRLIQASSEPWEVCGKIYHVTLSIGVAMAPDDGMDADGLIRKADRALYQAKRSGKNQLMWYVSKMNI
ncbi:sensor domain-containing diguanylate cyclase [Tenuibacillus multivorans]|uniref:PAS domain S-box-containing protein/diguanylate cyclase (GGDEF) domain-containing protein n=1 Tax=Tenuibacillus multivorans TaxID=237069 RepID=A0A1H0AXM5_9BACI|nr:sensor domain-containing diguanylate cyclase [Tenuibacillus multivorans]GEL77624.1 hypothetical protein TMU01_18590 [Tenuibacillus multivorans]SDN38167.1 PAS domain S-box-containing protein/diguanylate cyclase (GGDEF) domain-containing protein [Tenuibacillus multivorans]